MRPIYQLLSLSYLAIKRIWNHMLLMVCLCLGITVAVGIVSAIPLFTDATQNRLLQGELIDESSYRPPFAFLWRYVGAWNGNIDRATYEQVNQYLSEQAADEIGLPAREIVRHGASDNMRLFAASGTSDFNENTPLIWTSLAFLSNIEDQVRLVDGAYPTEGADLNGHVPILVSQTMADQLGAQIGEEFILLGAGGGQESIAVQIVAIWTPLDPTADYWFYAPDSFGEMLLTPETTFWAALEPQAGEKSVAVALWYLILDGRRVRPTTVNHLLEQIRLADTRTNVLLNHTELVSSPLASLESYDGSAGLLNLNLLIFSVPIVSLVLYFVTLIAGLVVYQGRSEIAILHSRGQSRGQILLVYLIQGVILCTVGAGLGLLLGGWLALAMGQTTSFLDITGLTDLAQSELTIVISPTAIYYAVMTASLGLPALLIPAWRASGYTIISLRTVQARSYDNQRPVWQRFYLDFLLLSLGLYGWYQLDQQNGLAILGRNRSEGNPFSDPLLFMVPVLFCFGLGLISLRLVPWLMNRLAELASYLPNTVLLITLRQLGRASAQYTGSMLFLTLTLSLAVFSASMARTLDISFN